MKIDEAGAVLTGFFSRPPTNEPSNRYSSGENEDYSSRPRMSHDKPQGYGTNPTYGSAGDPPPVYASGYASGGQTYGAPGAGGGYRGTETYAPTGQAPGGAEGYGPARDQYSSRPGHNDEASDSRYGDSRYSSDESAGRKSYDQYGGGSNAPGDDGYSSGGPRREGVEQRYGGRDPSYKSSQSEYGSKSGSGYNPSYGGPRDDGDGDRHSGISSGYKPPGSEYGAKSGSGYGASQAYGGRQGGGDNDKYPGRGYTAPDSDSYGTESQSGYNAPQSDGGPRRASGGGNAPSGGFLSGSGDASEPGTNSTYGGRGSGYGGRGDGTAEPPYDSNTSSGYNAPRRDQDTYPGTQSQGPPRRDNLGDVETDARYKQHFDAHAQAYG